MANKFYAVRQGRNPGIYRTWKDCQAQVSGFPCAQFKSFPALSEAEAFLNSSAGQDMEIDGQTLTAYVDGSYDHRKKEFSYGMVIRKKEGELYFAEKYADPALASMRNVAGEIKGAQKAMQYAVDRGYQKLAIYYDYEGIAKWCTGEWAAKKEGTKAYRSFYNGVKDRLQVRFVKVKGHSNDEYNDRADMLAKSALGIGDGSFVSDGSGRWMPQNNQKKK